MQQYCTLHIAARCWFGEYTKIENRICALNQLECIHFVLKFDWTEIHGYFDVTVKGASLIFNVKVKVKYISRLVKHYTHFSTKATEAVITVIL